METGIANFRLFESRNKGGRQWLYAFSRNSHSASNRGTVIGSVRKLEGMSFSRAASDT